MSARPKEKRSGTVLQEVKPMRKLAIHAMPRCAPVHLRSHAREQPFCYASVVLSYSLYHQFTNTRAGARFADKTRPALAFDQLRSRRTHVIAYAGGVF
jgi:hypothetical protein